MQTCRLIVDPGGAGDWNMALDEALLESAATDSPPCLRFYQWSQPTLSLGYFQESAERDQHAASRDAPLVRRASGGGAILHHHELTYSFTCHQRERYAVHPQVLYDAIHQTLVNSLSQWGIQSSLYQQIPPLQQFQPQTSAQKSSAEPFLCFERRALGDVVLEGKKICGSAQRRGKTGILQHGSILLTQSKLAPELPGIQELSGVALTPKSLQNIWTLRLAERLSLVFALDNPTPVEINLAEAIQAEKFGSDPWTHRR